MNSNLTYDVGMHNGDDTAYYLWLGFRVIAIEPNPGLVATASRRFWREIKTGQLTILNIAVAAEEGELPFWVCLTDDRLSALGSPEAAGSHAVREIRVPCRKFRSILDEHGVPYYMKIDIQGNDRMCVEAPEPGDVPQFLSIEFRLTDTALLELLRQRGFSLFKCISQTHFLPLELPPITEARLAQQTERLLRTRNIFVRVFRRFGGRRWLQRKLVRLRVRDGWRFQSGSSGPFGEDLPGRWLGHEELLMTTAQFLRLRQDAPELLLWAPAGLNPFWTDLHARSETFG